MPKKKKKKKKESRLALNKSLKYGPQGSRELNALLEDDPTRAGRSVPMTTRHLIMKFPGSAPLDSPADRVVVWISSCEVA